MHNYEFILGGKSNLDYGIVLQNEIKFSGASPSYDEQQIPGRNGSIVFWNANYENVTATASCYVLQIQDADRYRQRAVEFFLSSPGYLRLETDTEPDVYRMVLPTLGPDTDIRLRSIAPFTVQFSAKPQVFLKSGEMPLDIAESESRIVNPTAFSSMPEITVHGNAPGSLFVNGVECKILAISGDIILDCDAQEAYSTDGETVTPQNSNVAILEYPVLQSGKNVISWTGGIESVTIVPRWCYIT